MKKTLILSLITAAIISSCSEKAIEPTDLAQQLVEKYEKHTSISQDVNYKMKYFSEEDTIDLFAKIDLIRVPEDSIFGGHVWIDSDSIERYYDTENLFLIMHKTKSITRYKKEHPWPIKGNTVSGTIRTYFLDPYRLTRGVADTTNIVKLEKENIQNQATWKWNYVFPADEYTSSSWKNIWINQENFSIPKMNYGVEMQGEFQYNQWDITNISFDKVGPEDLKKRFEEILKTYTVEEYQERPREEMEPLAIGTKIPELSGEIYEGASSVSLEDYKGKLLLIDFWYTSCFPCIKAIPHLNELHQKYADEGLQVVGINPYDNDEAGLKRLPNFLEHNPMDYPIMFIEREEPKNFRVQAYPTFYLIDKEGQVLHSEVGFGESMVAGLDSLIVANL